jgi:hypothetical protein
MEGRLKRLAQDFLLRLAKTHAAPKRWEYPDGLIPRRRGAGWPAVASQFTAATTGIDGVDRSRWIGVI